MSRDPLSDLLRNVRLRGAVFFYISFRDQWSAEGLPAEKVASAVMPGCEHVMEYHVLLKGNGWAATSGLPPVRLAAGDIVMFPQGDRHVISSAPGLEPVPASAEWVAARRNDPKPVPIAFHHGVREPGVMLSRSDADAILVCGFLGCDVRPFNPLVAALPRVLHLPASRAGDWVTRVIDQAVVESNERRPGGEAVLERLSEMLFVDAARRYLDSLPEDATGWLAGLRDRFVGRALELLHGDPVRDWSVESLAREVGLSRSALHERFVHFLGQPPMQYLGSWRMQIAANRLLQSREPIAAVGMDLGYNSEAAFSRAFKRIVGTAPSAWRKQRQTGGPGDVG